MIRLPLHAAAILAIAIALLGEGRWGASTPEDGFQPTPVLVSAMAEATESGEGPVPTPPRGRAALPPADEAATLRPGHRPSPVPPHAERLPYRPNAPPPAS